MPDFAGTKLSQDVNAVTRFADVHKVTVERKCDRILTDEPGVIGAGSPNGGGNSGFQAVNLLAQFGVRRILLIGFDMRLDHGVHWHGRHPRGLNNPGESLMMHWRRAMNLAGADFAALGIEVLNLSPISTLTAYPFADARKVLGCR